MAKGLTVVEVVAISQLIMNLGVILYTYLATKSRATREELKDISDRQERHANRLTKLEADHSHMPDAREFMKLSSDMKTLEGTINKVAAELGGMRDISKLLRHQMETMDSYLRKVSK